MADFYRDTRAFPAGAAIAENLRVKLVGGELVVADDADEICIGYTTRPSFAQGDAQTVKLLNSAESQIGTATGAVAAGVELYAAANGQVAGTGTVSVGTSMSASGAAGDYIEIVPSGK